MSRCCWLFCQRNAARAPQPLAGPTGSSPIFRPFVCSSTRAAGWGCRRTTSRALVLRVGWNHRQFDLDSRVAAIPRGHGGTLRPCADRTSDPIARRPAGDCVAQPDGAVGSPMVSIGWQAVSVHRSGSRRSGQPGVEWVAGRWPGDGTLTRFVRLLTAGPRAYHWRPMRERLAVSERTARGRSSGTRVGTSTRSCGSCWAPSPQGVSLES